MGTRVELFQTDAVRIAEESGLLGRLSQQWKERAPESPKSAYEAAVVAYLEREDELTTWMGNSRFHPEYEPTYVLYPELPSWASIRLGLDADGSTLWTVQVTEASGWPMRALVANMRCAALADFPPSYWRVEYVGDLLHLGAENEWPARQVPDSSGKFTVWYWQENAMLPWRPLWSGLVVNIAAWSAAWFAVLLVAKSGLRKWRSTRGRCADCGYPALPGRACPECGRRNSPGFMGT